jgi:YidC/Oxa1 family membrane protein insertase
LIAVSLFQSLLDSIGAVLAWLYDLIPNYGVAIILLTLGIRVLLLPLAVKQIRSMQAMQAIAPKQKELQRKYKGNRQKIQEETMRLYKEEGVNPLSGCLPILAQFPVLIALFAVLSVPKGLPHVQGNTREGTRLYQDIRRNAGGIKFLGANLVCSASEAGRDVPIPAPKDKAYPAFTKKCGKGGPVRIPYYLFLAAMVATTYYQQKQMQRASPGQNQQQQMLARIMPAFFGFIGFTFPAGLVVYWTTTNVVQIIQQHFMLPKAPPGGPGTPKAQGNGGKRARPAAGSGAGGFEGRKAGGERNSPRRGQQRPRGGQNRGEGGGKPRQQGGKPRADGGGEPRASEGDKGSAGGGSPGQVNRPGRGPGGRDGDRKKRRKR